MGFSIGIGMNAGSERPKSLNSSVSPSADIGNLRRTESCGAFPIKLNSGNGGGNSTAVSDVGFEGADVSIKELYKNGDARKCVDMMRDENSVKESREGRERGSSRSSDINQNQNQNQSMGQNVSMGQSGCGCDGSKADSVGTGTGTGVGGVKSDVCAFRLSESMALVHAREILALSNRCVCVCVSVCVYVCVCLCMYV